MLDYSYHKHYTYIMKRRTTASKNVGPTGLSYVLLAMQAALLLAILTYPGIREGGAHILLANTLRIIGLSTVFVALWQLRNYSLSVLPEPVKGAQLCTRGLYGRMRHPIYSGIILWGIGTVMIRPGLVRAGLLLALILLFWFKTQREERLLAQAFGTRYARYCLSTARFIPRRRK